MLSTFAGGQGWTPLRLPGLVAWFASDANYVAQNATVEVTGWTSRDPNAIVVTTTGTDEPDWDANGWGSAIPAISFTAIQSPLLSSTSSTIVTPGSGTDVPFSLFCSVRQTIVADHTIVCWQDSGGTSLSSLRTNNSGGGIVRYRRTDAAGVNVDVDGDDGIGGPAIGFVRRRLGVIFLGTSVELYMDGARIAAASSDVGALTPDTFKIGSGPGIDAFTGFIRDIVVLNRAADPADYYAYYNWSRTTLGY